MRPQSSLRARRAVLALGASAVTTATVAVAPAAADTTPTGAQSTPATAKAAGAPPRARASVTVAERRLNVRAGSTAWVRGTVRADGTKTVRLQRRSGEDRWTTIARDRTDGRGRYRLRYRTKRAGSQAVRVRFSGDARTRPAAKELGRLNAFRKTFASWYGPGFYGKRTACGKTFSAGVMGVAHKTLPCGTRLTLRRGGRTARVRVIDRGPFASGREFDLSPAVKRALRFGSTGTVQTTAA